MSDKKEDDAPAPTPVVPLAADAAEPPAAAAAAKPRTCWVALDRPTQLCNVRDICLDPISPETNLACLRDGRTAARGVEAL